MKKLLSASLVLALLAAGSTAVHAGPVKVPDKNLEEALKKVLLEPKEGLTDENLVNVFVLEAVGRASRISAAWKSARTWRSCASRRTRSAT